MCWKKKIFSGVPYWRPQLLNALFYGSIFPILTNGEELLQHYTCMHLEIPSRNNCLLGERSVAVMAFSVKSVWSAKPYQWRMCRGFTQYPWALPPSNRSSKVLSCQYFCSKLSLREAVGGWKEVESLSWLPPWILPLISLLLFDADTEAVLPSSTKRSTLLAAFYVYFLFGPVMHISAEGSGYGIYFFSSLLSNRKVMAFLHFSRVKWRMQIPACCTLTVAVES